MGKYKLQILDEKPNLKFLMNRYKADIPYLIPKLKYWHLKTLSFITSEREEFIL